MSNIQTLDAQPQAIWRGIRYSDGQKEYRSKAESQSGATEIMNHFQLNHSKSGSGTEACIKDLSNILSDWVKDENTQMIFSSANLVQNKSKTNTGVLISCKQLWEQGVMDSNNRPLPKKSKQMCCFWVKNLCVAAVVSERASQVTQSALNRGLRVEVLEYAILIYFSKTYQPQTWNT